MPPQHNALDVYYKQVHRMIHERRQRENPEKKWEIGIDYEHTHSVSESSVAVLCVNKGFISVF